MIYRAKKIWMGHVSIRDYILDRLIRNGENLEIEYGNEYMNVSNRNIKTYLTNTYNTTFKSKFGSGDYKLIDIPWRPNE